MTKQGRRYPLGGGLGRRQFLRRAALLGLWLAASAACGGSRREKLTTLDGTAVLGEDGSLAPGPGEPYEVRTALAEAQAGRQERRRSLAVFHHFADFRLLDEESPLRSEWVESCPQALSGSAFRPQEALSLHAAAAIIAQANRVSRSPATGRRVDFAVHTGNAADNAQFNELRWFLDLMDGRPLAPDSGSAGYEGVQEKSPAPAYPDLLARAQLSFAPQGLRYPWYAVIGNRDVLAQGNFPPAEAANAIAVGTEKIIDIGPKAKERVCSDPSTLLDPGSSEGILRDPQTVVREVEGDPNRRLLTRKEWVAEHFRVNERPGPLGHGFQDDNRRRGTAYYVVEHGPISLIVLDTVNPGGFAAGSMDATQFAWLEEQLVARSGRYVDAAGRQVTTQSRDRLIVVVSHHTAAAMNNPFPDPASQEERVRGPQLEVLLHRFPNVVLHVAGHGLEHRLLPRPDPARQTQGFWEVTTASPLDFPMQARLLEIVDNGDGTISILATVYDSAAALVPGQARDLTPDDGLNETLLASLARLVGVQDPQLDRDAPGLAASDRNAELLLRAPFTLSQVETPEQHQPAGPAGAPRQSRRVG